MNIAVWIVSGLLAAAYLFAVLDKATQPKTKLVTSLPWAEDFSPGTIKLIGVIPESEAVLQASNQGLPAVHMNGTDVSEAYKDVIDRFLGQTDKPMRFIDAEKPGFFKRLFGGK